MNQFDAIIVGAGQAGPALAARLSQAGQRIALIERKFFGGTCVNTGCIPTKTLVASAYAAEMARRAASFGVTIEGKVGVDMKAVKARKDAISGKSRTGVEAGLRGLAHCTVYQGQARFESPTQIRVGDELLTAEKIFLNVGGRAIIPDFPGVEKIPPSPTAPSSTWIRLPQHLVIVGGGYIGLEFAQIFRRFGSEVTIIERAPRLVRHEDEDISAAIAEILQNEGIQLRLNAECIHFDHRDGQPVAGVDCDEGEPEIMGSHVLLAMGRRPNTDDLGLEHTSACSDEQRLHLRSTTSCAPLRPASGPWATATDEARFHPHLVQRLRDRRRKSPRRRTPPGHRPNPAPTPSTSILPSAASA